MKKLVIALVILVICGLGYYLVRNYLDNRLNNNPNFTGGNGRIEATEINIAAKLAGKVEKIKVREGDMVKDGDILVVMQTNVLEAQLAQARAKLQQSIAAEASNRAQIAVSEATYTSKKAYLEKMKADELNAKRRFDRYKTLVERDATSKQDFENAETVWLSRKADRASAEADVKEAQANMLVAKANWEASQANILAAEADIGKILADIDDSILRAPLSGRIQYRVAEPGEVLSAGGRAINMVDLTDVYMTFFLSEEMAGKVKLGADARIVLDAAPTLPVDAKITYIASVSQFTPKTVETKIERQKLMFRVKAHVNREFLLSIIDYVKTGLPGVVWVRLNDNEPWPKELMTKREREMAASPKGAATAKAVPAPAKAVTTTAKAVPAPKKGENAK